MQSLEVIGRMLGRELSRSEIADALDVHVSTISRRITGREGFRLEEVLQMCDFFEVSRCRTLVDLGYLSPEDVSRVAGDVSASLASISEIQILEELTSRARTRDAHAGTATSRARKRKGKGFLT